MDFVPCEERDKFVCGLCTGSLSVCVWRMSYSAIFQPAHIPPLVAIPIRITLFNQQRRSAD